MNAIISAYNAIQQRLENLHTDDPIITYYAAYQYIWRQCAPKNIEYRNMVVRTGQYILSEHDERCCFNCYQVMLCCKVIPGGIFNCDNTFYVCVRCINISRQNRPTCEIRDNAIVMPLEFNNRLLIIKTPAGLYAWHVSVSSGTHIPQISNGANIISRAILRAHTTAIIQACFALPGDITRIILALVLTQ